MSRHIQWGGETSALVTSRLTSNCSVWVNLQQTSHTRFFNLCDALILTFVMP